MTEIDLIKLYHSVNEEKLIDLLDVLDLKDYTFFEIDPRVDENGFYAVTFKNKDDMPTNFYLDKEKKLIGISFNVKKEGLRCYLNFNFADMEENELNKKVIEKTKETWERFVEHFKLHLRLLLS